MQIDIFRYWFRISHSRNTFEKSIYMCENMYDVGLSSWYLSFVKRRSGCVSVLPFYQHKIYILFGPPPKKKNTKELVYYTTSLAPLYFTSL